MMRRLQAVIILLFFATPMNGWALREHGPPAGASGYGNVLQRSNGVITERFRQAMGLPVVRQDSLPPAHRDNSGRRIHRPGHRRPPWVWPVTSTVVRETRTIIIVAPPMEAPTPPPKPRYEWVPPVMDTRTEPGYWDYGVNKIWMGDHWRFEQNVREKTWVPPAEVTTIKQAGYWKAVD